MKKTAFILLATVLCLVGCLTGCGSQGDRLEKEKEFCDLVEQTQELLDDIADTIYSNWHGAIYDDEFYGDINRAIAAAVVAHQEDLDVIEQNDVRIKELYQSVREGDLSTECKAIMQCYNDYYEFVVNVSGSFNSFSADKETLKKALASAIRNLNMEL